MGGGEVWGDWEGIWGVQVRFWVLWGHWGGSRGVEVTSGVTFGVTFGVFVVQGSLWGPGDPNVPGGFGVVLGWLLGFLGWFGGDFGVFGVTFGFFSPPAAQTAALAQDLSLASLWGRYGVTVGSQCLRTYGMCLGCV